MITTVTSLTILRRDLRRLAFRYGLPVETRARLVLSAVEVARPRLAAGLPLNVRAGIEYGGADPRFLAVELSAPWPGATLPLPCEPGREAGVVWRIGLPSPLPLDDPSETVVAEEAVEEELALALSRVDALSTQQDEMRSELAETDRGLVALYVELEERDERLRLAHNLIFRELEAALRPPPPLVEGVELAVHYVPAGDDAPTGGDLYDWFTLPDGALQITVVDAIGHGVESTRSALNVTHAVRTLVLERHPLESIVARTADTLVPTFHGLMATLQLARLDTRTGELRLANGGHPFPLLVRADGTARYLEAWGSGVGFPFPGSDAVLHDRLAPGDLLLLYTDGLTESRRDLDEGERLLMSSALRHAHLPLPELIAAIVADLHSVILHADDTLLLGIRLPAGEPHAADD
ncbi:PP2C family protein-serine/threonine phosphatase [Nonomuraea dietziae]|uniref:PP2C family protein-serine/threonine phosphatase n=1 Tax=Nonomuraea dietziae TaxID=65515 RepID=UPI003411B6AE